MHRTNVELDEKLVKEGMRMFKKKTKKELLNFALREVIRREKVKGILAPAGGEIHPPGFPEAGPDH